MNSRNRLVRRSPQEWLSSLPIILLLLLTISAETFEYTHAQLLKLGERLWQDYYTLRVDMPPPSCDPALEIDHEVERLRKESEAEPVDDELGGLFEPEPFNEVAARESLLKRLEICRDEHAKAKNNQARITTDVRLFRALESAIAAVGMAVVDQQRVILLLLLFVAAATSTVTRHHITFRPVKTKIDYNVTTVAQMLGNLVLAFSAWSHQASLAVSGISNEHPEATWLMVVGFLVLAMINFYQLIKRPETLESEGRGLASLLTIPLYTYMAFIAGNYFIFTEGNAAGVAIYVGQLMEQAKLFLKIGLYIWIGMLLKQTRLGDLVFNVFKPWKLPPEILAVLALLVMAVPTAYTGASGIIIIAMGVVVYEELRKVGARRQLALATTAMSGSSGVVLRPCLLVVLIAALNKEVVTDQLYGWGTKVFILSTLFFLLMVILTRQQKLEMASWRNAIKPSMRALVPLGPYVLVFVLVAGVYALLLNAYLDEFSAPVILPIIVLCIVFYEKVIAKPTESGVGYSSDSEGKGIAGFECSVRLATSEASVHIGALIMLMGLSFATGGVIERSGFFEILPETFANIWVAMSLLLVVLVVIGMVMDPFGAVVLVTGTIASIAYHNGVDPVHFWMVTLVAFELGYLSPPVALNHLLTRQVVGEHEAALAAQEGANFWYRYEKILLPLVVMAMTLLVVAYIPLLFY